MLARMMYKVQSYKLEALNNFEVPHMVCCVVWIVAILFNCLEIVVQEMCGWSKAIGTKSKAKHDICCGRG